MSRAWGCPNFLTYCCNIVRKLFAHFGIKKHIYITFREKEVFHMYWLMLKRNVVALHWLQNSMKALNYEAFNIWLLETNCSLERLESKPHFLPKEKERAKKAGEEWEKKGDFCSFPPPTAGPPSHPRALGPALRQYCNNAVAKAGDRTQECTVLLTELHPCYLESKPRSFVVPHELGINTLKRNSWTAGRAEYLNFLHI